MDNKYIEQLRTQVDMQKAFTAGLLHDCAKCVPDDVKIAECEQFGLPISDIELEIPYLHHSKLGAYYAAHKYNVEDDEICSAIQQESLQ